MPIIYGVALVGMYIISVIIATSYVAAGSGGGGGGK